MPDLNFQGLEIKKSYDSYWRLYHKHRSDGPSEANLRQFDFWPSLLFSDWIAKNVTMLKAKVEEKTGTRQDSIDTMSVAEFGSVFMNTILEFIKTVDPPLAMK